MKVNVPVYDQRTQIGNDGRPPEDGNQDCVPTSLAAMAAALLGRPFTGDGLHDAVYGEGYTGLQNPARYVAHMATLGLDMVYLSDTPDRLVARAIAEINAGHPVLLSIPSDWDANPPHSSFAHMVAGCDVDPSGATLTVMNPWGTREDGYAHAAYQTETTDWWRDRLTRCSYQGIWILSKIGVPIVADTGLGSGFAAYQTAHPEIGACVSGGEHVYDSASGSSFAGFEHAPYVLTFYQGKVHDDLGGYTAAALWNELVGARDAAAKAAAAQQTAETNAAALAKTVSALSGQLATAKAALKQTDADLAATESENGNLREELASAQGQVSHLMGQLEQARTFAAACQTALAALLAVVSPLRAALAALGIK